MERAIIVILNTSNYLLVNYPMIMIYSILLSMFFFVEKHAFLAVLKTNEIRLVDFKVEDMYHNDNVLYISG